MAENTTSSPNKLQQVGEHLMPIDIHGTVAALLAERELLDSLIAALEDTLGDATVRLAPQCALQSKRRRRNRNSHEINRQFPSGSENRRGR